jgi:4-amino-4-deoxy-L-arabinose transferase-like glycosyltransferase
LAVALAGLVALVFKLAIAANTFGTDDVHSFIGFAKAIREFGPVGIYGQDISPLLYNHGPLTSWLLMAINGLVDLGLGDVPFWLRVPASLADSVTALAVFELVRLRRSVREAGIAAILLVLSPVLIVISGFHGNTDPVFVMFCLVSVYLLVVRPSTASTVAAGACLALALSIKLPPVVLVPVLAVVAWRSGGLRRLLMFAAGGGAVLLVLWGPVVATEWTGFSKNVLSYGGVWARPWGVPQIIEWLQVSPRWTDLLVGPGRYVILLVASLVPAVLVWLRPKAVVPAVGLPLVLFLFLSPAFGPQYLVWPLAGAYLINTWAATAYSMAGSAMVLQIYDHWNSAYPWNWYEARASITQGREFVYMVATWEALGVVALIGLLLFRNRDKSDSSPEGSETDAHVQETVSLQPPATSLVG